MYFKIVFVLLIVQQIANAADLRISSSNHQKLELVPCEHDNDCEEIRGKCVDSFCKCNGSHVCEDQSSVKVSRLGAACKESHQCNMEHGECSKDHCICKEGFVADKSNRKCLEVSAGLGHDCSDDAQCGATTRSSQCRQNKCACREDMHEHNGACYKIVGLSEECTNNLECSKAENAKCINSKCECEENFVAHDTTCLPIAESIGAPCREDVQCTAHLGTGSSCSDGFCHCRDMYQIKNTTGQCVREMMLNENCTMNSDCHQPHRGPNRLECVMDVCRCGSAYFQQDGHCISSSAHYLLASLFFAVLPALLFITL